MAEAIRILVVEDNPGDVRLIQATLTEADPRGFAVTLAATLADGLARLADSAFDLVLLDLSLPDSFGLDTLARLRAQAPALPIVVLTGNSDEQQAVKAVQAGAQDYLVKGQGGPDLLARAIRYAIERARSDQALRRSEAQLRAIFDNAAVGIALWSAEGRCLNCNSTFAEMLGHQVAEVVGRGWAELSHPDDLPSAQSACGDLHGGRIAQLDLETRFLTRAGEVVWVRINSSLADIAGHDGPVAVAMIEDVTEKKRLEDYQRLAAQVVDGTSEGVFITDADLRILHVNPAFTTLTGFEPAEVVGHKPSIMSSGRHGRDFYKRLWDELAAKGRWQGEIWNRRKTGELFAEWLSISMVRNARGDVTNYVAVFSDITSRKQNEERLNYQANHDPLTTLPNRSLFMERLSRALARAHRNHLLVAVLFLDLDGFKGINDTHGHLVGDLLLQAVAERLSSCVRQGDTVARLGGDEFTIILEDIADFRDAAVVAQKILKQFANPFMLEDHHLRVTTSIGVAVYPADGTDGLALLHSADEAMYRAKKQGKNAYQFHSEELNAQAFERMSLESALRLALERDEFRLYYQPIYDLASGRLISAEALLRWQHPEIGLVAPAHFLPLAEETGLILPIGRWAIEQACRQAAGWARQGCRDLKVAINLSRSQLFSFDIIGCLSAALADSGVDPALIQLEIPESSVMSGTPENEAVVRKLKALGVCIAIDDFGTGYSSFGNLRRLPVDILKIDQSFVRDITQDADDAKIVNAITAIAHSLRMTVVAEGVETAEQVEFLRKSRCDAVQGYYFTRPGPADEIPGLLATKRGEPVS